MYSTIELRDVIKSGLLSFPVTPFTPENTINEASFCKHLEWLAEYEVAGLIVAGGTGELFSLTPLEVAQIVRLTRTQQPHSAIIAGCGYGTKMAIEMAAEIKQAGADGILLLPHYLIAAAPEGIEAHIRAVCQSTDLAVIVYNRGLSMITDKMLLCLCEDCPNLIGFKDGTGNIEMVKKITLQNGSRLAYIGGMPTHELFAQAYRGTGVDTYSSAVFNFVPETALKFYHAFMAGDDKVCDQLLQSFYYPFAKIRDRKKGYAVSAIKCGVGLRGFNTGPVRPPLTDLSHEEAAMMQDLIDSQS